MKKFLLNLILLVSIPYLFSTDKNPKAPTLTSAECWCLNNIYQRYQNNPLFYESYDFKTVTNIINLLEKNIHIIKNDIIQETNWQTNTLLQKKIGLGIAIVLPWLIMGIAAICTLYEESYELFSKKFNHINIPLSLLNNISSTRFTMAEKRYLKKFSVDKITANDSLWRSENAKITHSINNLSKRNKEKLTYTALNYAIEKQIRELKSTVKIFTLIPLIANIICILEVQAKYYATLNHSQNSLKTLAEKLKTNLDLYTILNKHLASLPF
jgi:hypothetical protein